MACRIGAAATGSCGAGAMHLCQARDESRLQHHPPPATHPQPTHGEGAVAAVVLKAVGAQGEGDEGDVRRVHGLQRQPAVGHLKVALCDQLLGGLQHLAIRRSVGRLAQWSMGEVECSMQAAWHRRLRAVAWRRQRRLRRAASGSTGRSGPARCFDRSVASDGAFWQADSRPGGSGGTHERRLPFSAGRPAAGAPQTWLRLLFRQEISKLGATGLQGRWLGNVAFARACRDVPRRLIRLGRMLAAVQSHAGAGPWSCASVPQVLPAVAAPRRRWRPPAVPHACIQRDLANCISS